MLCTTYLQACPWAAVSPHNCTMSDCCCCLVAQVQLQAKTKVAVQQLGADWLVIYDGPSTATTFSALQPGCQYMFRVAAANSAGQGQFCVPMQLTTAADAPMAPDPPEGKPSSTVREAAVRLWVSGIIDSSDVVYQCYALLHGPYSCRLHDVQQHLSMSCVVCPVLLQSLVLEWGPPPHDGGSPLTSYRVEMRCSPNHTPQTMEGLHPEQTLALMPHFLTIYRWVMSMVPCAVLQQPRFGTTVIGYGCGIPVLGVAACHADLCSPVGAAAVLCAAAWRPVCR